MYICFAWFYLAKQWKNVQERKYLPEGGSSERKGWGWGDLRGGGGLRAKTLMDLFIELKKKKINHVTILRKFY